MSAAITGWAWRTALGASVPDACARLLAGERAARENPRFDARSYPCTLAAPVSSEPRASRHRRFVKRMGLLAMECGLEALADAGVAGGERTGVFAGYGGLRAHWDDLMPVLAGQAHDGSAEGAWERGFKLLHPFWMLNHLSNNAQALLSIDIGARGDGVTTGGANASAQALVSAVAALQAGAIDVALVIAYDTLIEPEVVMALATAGMASTAAAPAAPYDLGAAGVVPGEAAAAVVLERDSPRARARVRAFAGADGARGWPGPQALADAATGAGAAPAFAAGAGAPGVIDGAGTADRATDAGERAALAHLGADTPLTAITSAFGQLGGATSLVQSIALTHCLSRGELPPIAGLVHAAPGPLRPLARAETTRARTALALSAGAPGLTAAVVLELP